MWAHNSFYDFQQLQLAAAEKKVADAIQQVASFQVIEPPTQRPTDEVSLFSKVKVLKYNDNTEEELIWEICPYGRHKDSSKVSYNSPVAKAILGLMEGEEVEVRLPGGVFTIEIMELIPEKLSKEENSNSQPKISNAVMKALEDKAKGR